MEFKRIIFQEIFVNIYALSFAFIGDARYSIGAKVLASLLRRGDCGTLRLVEKGRHREERRERRCVNDAEEEKEEMGEMFTLD